MSSMLFERSKPQVNHSLCGAMKTDSGVAFTAVQHQCPCIDNWLFLFSITLQRRTKAHLTSNVLHGNGHVLA